MTPSDQADLKSRANTPVWADLISPAPARARDFYSALFGTNWLETAAHLHHAVDAPWANLHHRGAQWIPRFAVENAATAARHAQELGARVIDTSAELSLLEDPNSSPFILTPLTPAQVSPALTWVELRTSERNQTTSFYSQLFSWTTRSADFGSSEYTQFISHNKPVAGMLLSPETVARASAPHWGVTFRVEDLEQAIARALESGGALVYGPMNAEWGISAALTDPSGASFNIVEPIEVAISKPRAGRRAG